MLTGFTAARSGVTGRSPATRLGPSLSLSLSLSPSLFRALSRTRAQALALGVVAVAVAAPVQSGAQTWPQRQVTLIVPFPPGGSTDVVARIMAEHMRPLLGQPVIVENVGGAGGTIGVGRVARAAPDGYTIDIGQWDTHVGGVIYSLNYDLVKDFEPIGLLSINPQLMVGRRSLPADDLGTLTSYMKANPGKVTLVNQLASAQVAGQLMYDLSGVNFQLIPYRGAGPAITDLLAGQVDVMVSQAAVVLPNIRAGTIKALANMSPRRSAAIPDIKAAGESGLPGLHASGWFGMFAPAGTPKDVIARLNAAMVGSLGEGAVRARFGELGLDIASAEQQTPQGLAAFHRAEIDRWWPVLKSLSFKAD